MLHWQPNSKESFNANYCNKGYRCHDGKNHQTVRPIAAVSQANFFLRVGIVCHYSSGYEEYHTDEIGNGKVEQKDFKVGRFFNVLYDKFYFDTVQDDGEYLQYVCGNEICQAWSQE